MFIFDIYFLSFSRDLMIIFCIGKPITVKYTVCKKLDNNSANHAFVPCLEHKTFKIVFVITISVPILFLLLCA